MVQAGVRPACSIHLSAVTARTGSFNRTGAPRETSTSASQPCTSATASAVLPIAAWSRTRSCSSKVRRIPSIFTAAGTTLGELPPVIEPTVRTVGFVGSTWREIRCWRVPIRSAAATTGSAVRCGYAACPGRPLTTIVNSSAAALTGPGVAAK